MVTAKESLHELVSELKALRGVVRETAEGFILRTEGEIEALLDYLLKMPPNRLKAVARPCMQQARELKLKPAKGRLKDLKRIDKLLHDLLNCIIEADDPAQKPKLARKKVRRASNKKSVATEVVPPS